ncbi:hypothetical protein Scep_001879 [Stephania cephalantha]|uniref:Pentatricopeptide repeat-containing protein n=1 Tax=Stephania cephalantha TaxID=152367 RepID=A0AAP0Q4F1_9MAGN
MMVGGVNEILPDIADVTGGVCKWCSTVVTSIANPDPLDPSFIIFCPLPLILFLFFYVGAGMASIRAITGTAAGIISSEVPEALQCVEIGKKVFDEMPQRGLVLWTALIHSYISRGVLEEGVEVFVKMREVGVMPHDRVALDIVVSGCSQLGG